MSGVREGASLNERQPALRLGAGQEEGRRRHSPGRRSRRCGGAAPRKGAHFVRSTRHAGRCCAAVDECGAPESGLATARYRQPPSPQRPPREPSGARHPAARRRSARAPLCSRPPCRAAGHGPRPAFGTSAPSTAPPWSRRRVGRAHRWARRPARALGCGATKSPCPGGRRGAGRDVRPSADTGPSPRQLVRRLLGQTAWRRLAPARRGGPAGPPQEPWQDAEAAQPGDTRRERHAPALTGLPRRPSGRRAAASAAGRRPLTPNSARATAARREARLPEARAGQCCAAAECRRVLRVVAGVAPGRRAARTLARRLPLMQGLDDGGKAAAAAPPPSSTPWLSGGLGAERSERERAPSSQRVGPAPRRPLHDVGPFC